ncbi:MAG: hypothetical protein V4573_06240 [Pseudomonadota bacterium]
MSENGPETAFEAIFEATQAAEKYIFNVHVKFLMYTAKIVFSAFDRLSHASPPPS